VFAVKVRLSLVVPGVILLALGLLWSLQGAGVLRGSFMTGQRQWLVIGLVVGIAGLVLSYAGMTPRAGR
jgi:hypothetical protein